MPNIDASIPLQQTKVDPFATLGSIAQTANALTTLKRGQLQLKQEQGALDAKTALMELANDPQMRDQDTGLIDLNKFTPAAYARDPMGLVANEAVQKIAKTNSDLMTLKTQGLQLGEAQRAYPASIMGTLAVDPALTREKVTTSLNDAVKVAPAFAPMAEIIKRHIAETHDNPEALRGLVTQYRNFAFPGAAFKPDTSFVQTGAATQPVQGNPLAGPVGPTPGGQPIPNAVGPSGAEQRTTDALGNPVIEATAPNGQKSYKPMPGANTPPLMALPPGETKESGIALLAAREATNRAALTVPDQHFNNAQIIKLADATNTGEGARIMAGLKGNFAGIPWSTNAADNYNRLGHFIALQAQQNAAAMGAGTDASRAVSEQATASTGWTREAIKSATKVNDALATGVDLFNRGKEAAINNPANQKSIFAARDFQNAWSQNFDVNAVRLYNAAQSGDTKEVASIVNEVGGKNSAGAKALAQKVRVISNLVRTGQP